MKNQSFEVGRAYEIFWKDHVGCGTGHWQDPEDVLSDFYPATVTTVGWVLKDDDDFVIIANNIIEAFVDEELYMDQIGEAMLILKSTIESSKNLAISEFKGVHKEEAVDE